YVTAAQQRQWCEQKAFMYGNAIEAAIVAQEGKEAITYLELARNRYLDGVAREHGISRRGGIEVVHSGLDEEGILISNALEDVIATNTALVWCGGFPHGLGIVAAWRDAAGIQLANAFFPEITGQDLSALFQGDISNALAAHEAGRSVEFIVALALQE